MSVGGEGAPVCVCPCDDVIKRQGKRQVRKATYTSLTYHIVLYKTSSHT